MRAQAGDNSFGIGYCTTAEYEQYGYCTFNFWPADGSATDQAISLIGCLVLGSYPLERDGRSLYLILIFDSFTGHPSIQFYHRTRHINLLVAPHLSTMAERLVPKISLKDFDNRKDEIREQLIRAAETAGFLTLVDHGISAEEIEAQFSISKAFFALPKETKGKTPHSTVTNNGWEYKVRKP